MLVKYPLKARCKCVLTHIIYQKIQFSGHCSPLFLLLMDYLFVTNILKYDDSCALFTGSAHQLLLSSEKKKKYLSLKIKTSSCKEEPVCQI